MTSLATTTVRGVSDVVTKGTTPTSLGKRFTHRGTPFIKVETIDADGRLIPEKVAFIDSTTHDLLRRSQLREGDILFSIAGALGRSTVVEKAWLPANTNQAFAIIRPSKRSSIQPQYLLWALRSDAVQSRIGEINVQAAQANLSLEQVRDFEIPVPAPERQQQVATALDDAAQQIAALDRLISKKQEIKQGVMQQLLTGRIRLPGFSSAWSTRTLSSVGSFRKGRGIRRDDVRSSGVACIRYGELYTTYRDYTSVTHSYVSPPVAAAALPINHGDLLFAGSGETREEIGMCVAFTGKHPVVAGGDIVVLRAPTVNPVYLASLTNMPAVAKQKARLGQGDAVVHVSSRALASIEVDLPPRDEQDAIAEVLLDADAEIRLLVARLIKAKAIKQGMMQQLFTGRPHLPVSEPAA